MSSTVNLVKREYITAIKTVNISQVAGFVWNNNMDNMIATYDDCKEATDNFRKTLLLTKEDRRVRRQLMAVGMIASMLFSTIMGTGSIVMVVRGCA